MTSYSLIRYTPTPLLQRIDQVSIRRHGIKTSLFMMNITASSLLFLGSPTSHKRISRFLVQIRRHILYSPSRGMPPKHYTTTPQHSYSRAKQPSRRNHSILSPASKRSRTRRSHEPLSRRETQRRKQLRSSVCVCTCNGLTRHQT